MQLSKESNAAQYQITSYTADSITINASQTFTQSILLMPDYVAPWHIQDLTSLKQTDMFALLVFKPEILILGTGNVTIWPPAEITQVLFAQGLGFECMSTASACRTYTALSAEGRKVLAALIITR